MSNGWIIFLISIWVALSVVVNIVKIGDTVEHTAGGAVINLIVWGLILWGIVTIAGRAS
jgi:hypothetical protein